MTSNYWLGNEVIYRLVSMGTYILRVEIIAYEAQLNIPVHQDSLHRIWFGWKPKLKLSISREQCVRSQDHALTNHQHKPRVISLRICPRGFLASTWQRAVKIIERYCEIKVELFHFSCKKVEVWRLWYVMEPCFSSFSVILSWRYAVNLSCPIISDGQQTKSFVQMKLILISTLRVELVFVI